MSDGANPYAAFGGTTSNQPAPAPATTPAPSGAPQAGGDPYAAFGGASFTPTAPIEPREGGADLPDVVISNTSRLEAATNSAERRNMQHLDGL